MCIDLLIIGFGKCQIDIQIRKKNKTATYSAPMSRSIPDIIYKLIVVWHG